jgi:hypothetical protein
VDLKTWSQNPSLEAAIQNCLEYNSPIFQNSYWKLFQTEIEGNQACVIYWYSTVHSGALIPEGVNALVTWLETWQVNGIQAIYFIFDNSAGADVTTPFESLTCINRLIEVLSRIKLNYSLTIIGCVMGFRGTFGGSSILMTTICDTLWCHQQESLHVLGKAR